jgi:DNA-directed RNA polymerase specialized sigma24 family protein
VASSRSQAHHDEEARAFLASLEERVRRSVRLYRGLPEGPGRTLEEVGRILGVSKSTVENDNKLFRERFARWTEVRRLDGEEIQQLQVRVLALLGTEDYSWPEGESAP